MHIAIIGNGIAGITTARHIRKLSDHQITVISAETDHFFSRTALMYIYMGHMRFRDTKPYEDWFWEKNRIELKKARVEQIDHSEKKLSFSGGEKMQYDKLVLTLGSASNKFGWPGQDLKGVQGFYSIPDLEEMEKSTKSIRRAVIVGGGLIGIEVTEMLHSRGIPVTFLVREKSFWNKVLPSEESEMINRHICENHIDLRLQTVLKEIIADENGRAKAVITGSGEQIDCQFVALTAGVHPNIDFLKETKIETERGILTNEFLETNIEDVYAAGDCVQLKTPPPGRRPIEAIWYVGRMQGETLAKTICGERTKYEPGIWFNSAKFFDIEYQVYGFAPTKYDDETKTFYWEHPDGKKSIRLIYSGKDGRILGFNLMGVRFRHNVCNSWLEKGTHIREVLTNLGVANFDPEFSSQFEHKVVAEFNRRNPQHKITLKRTRGLSGLIELFT